MAASRQIALLGLSLLAAGIIAGLILAHANSSPPPPSSVSAAKDAPTEPDLTPPVAHLSIKKAVYGDLPDGQCVDVTDQITLLASKNSLSVTAENDELGADPAPGLEKKLRINYTLDDVVHSKIVTEHQNLKIIARTGPATLIIKKALYGDLPGGTATDVTKKVAQIAEDDLSIAATSDNFGDPAPTISKTLQVTYILDGREITKTVAEGQTLILSGDQ